MPSPYRESNKEERIKVGRDGRAPQVLNPLRAAVTYRRRN